MLNVYAVTYFREVRYEQAVILENIRDHYKIGG
jgi:hypothetical protein